MSDKLKPSVPKCYISGEEELRFTYDFPTAQAPYTFRLEGTCYGKKWSSNMNHSGLKILIIQMMEAL